MFPEVLASFGQSVVVNGTTVQGIFRSSTKGVDEAGVLVNIPQPRLVLKASDVPTLAEKQSVLVEGQAYRIRQIHRSDADTVECWLVKESTP